MRSRWEQQVRSERGHMKKLQRQILEQYRWIGWDYI
jgi:hypothetical protein